MAYILKAEWGTGEAFSDHLSWIFLFNALITVTSRPDVFEYYLLKHFSAFSALRLL